MLIHLARSDLPIGGRSRACHRLPFLSLGPDMLHYDVVDPFDPVLQLWRFDWLLVLSGTPCLIARGGDVEGLAAMNEA